MSASASPLPNFRNRDELRDWIVSRFDIPSNDHTLSPIVGGRSVGLRVLQQIDPPRYAATRNFLDGAVTRLSPYLRHGAITLAEVRDLALARAPHPAHAEKLITELAWRDYYQRVHHILGERIWQDIEPLKTGRPPRDYAPDLPADIPTAQTGLACIDAFTRDLIATGYLHNHARMWFAAYVIHFRRIRWQAGARFFLQHLLDGDPASNNLSWQWVASTFAAKPYIFNRENLERFTGGSYCRDCPARQRCPFDADYDRLNHQLFKPTTDQPAPNNLTDTAHLRCPPDDPPDQRPIHEPAITWIHDDTLSPVSPALAPDRPAIYVFDRAAIRQARPSLKRLAFIIECLREIPNLVIDGHAPTPRSTLETLRAFADHHHARTIITTPSPDPHIRSTLDQLAHTHPILLRPPPTFVHLHQPTDLRRFTRYWQSARKSLSL